MALDRWLDRILEALGVGGHDVFLDIGVSSAKMVARVPGEGGGSRIVGIAIEPSPESDDPLRIAAVLRPVIDRNNLGSSRWRVSVDPDAPGRHEWTGRVMSALGLPSWQPRSSTDALWALMKAQTSLKEAQGPTDTLTGCLFIGASQSRFLAWDERGIRLVRPFAMAGVAMTESLMRWRRCSRDEAERVKIEEGVLHVDGEVEGNIAVSRVLRPVLDTLAQKVRNAYGELLQERPAIGIAGLYVAGGASKFPGLDRWFQRELDIPVQRLAWPEAVQLAVPDAELFRAYQQDFEVLIGHLLVPEPS